eukprot:GHVS01094246.1.p1 GENE.GHVS01094246.1~~GHVS01094246.1.p1  ORF type:complete len:566 (+),score=98.77 GHVS01094246.1:118-1815(+)
MPSDRSARRDRRYSVDRGDTRRKDRSRDRRTRSRERTSGGGERKYDREQRWGGRTDSKCRDRGGGGKKDERRAWRFDSPPRDGNSEAFGGSAMALLLGNTAALFSSANSITADTCSSSELASLDAAQSKAAREIYVGNLPAGVEVNQLTEFMNSAMLALKGNTMPGPSVIKVWISTDSHYAFVELRTIQEASNAMQLNGLSCLGIALRIGRPKTFPAELSAIIPPPTVPAVDASFLSQGVAGVQSCVKAREQDRAAEVARLHAAQPHHAHGAARVDPAAALAAAHTAANAVAAGVPVAQFVNRLKTPDRLCIMGLPVGFSEAKVKEMVTTFGCVKFFQLLRKGGSGESAGCCLCDFEDYECQKTAIEILEQNTPYKVVLAEDAASTGMLDDYLRRSEDLNDGPEQTMLVAPVPCRVIFLSNMFTRDDLLDEALLQEMRQDILIELEQFGTVMDIHIPLPARGFDENEFDESDIGFVFVEYKLRVQAAKARGNLYGRKFNGRVIEVNYFGEEKFARKEFKGPAVNYGEGTACVSHEELGFDAGESPMEMEEEEEREDAKPPLDDDA